MWTACHQTKATWSSDLVNEKSMSDWNHKLYQGLYQTFSSFVTQADCIKAVSILEWISYLGLRTRAWAAWAPSQSSAWIGRAPWPCLSPRWLASTSAETWKNNVEKIPCIMLDTDINRLRCWRKLMYIMFSQEIVIKIFEDYYFNCKSFHIWKYSNDSLILTLL